MPKNFTNTLKRMKMTGKIVDRRTKVAPNIIRGLVILILLYIIFFLTLTVLTKAGLLKT